MSPVVISTRTSSHDVPVRVVENQPAGWTDAVLPYLLARNKEAHEAIHRDGSVPVDGAFEQITTKRIEERWQQKTGVPPTESRFTLVVPIHNEERLLRSFLAAFALSEIPLAVPITTVFVTNGCTDKSSAIVRRFLSEIGNIEDYTHAARLSERDPGLTKVAPSVVAHAQRFILLETTTLSKAHALELGTHVASIEGAPIVMSVDANNWVEPQTIRNLYAAARRSFVENKGEVGAVFGRDICSLSSRNRSLFTFIVRMRYSSQQPTYLNGRIAGWLMAWPTEFIEQNGFPRNAAEDYALSVELRRRGLKAELVPDAKIWGYRIGTLRDLASAHARSMRGRMQLIRHYAGRPEEAAVSDILKRDGFNLTFKGRCLALIGQIRSAPAQAPLKLARFLLDEYAFWRAARDFARNPDNASWEPLPSTKHL